VTLNLSQVFLKYPDVFGAAGALRSHLASRAKSDQDVPQHILVATGTPWLALLAWGNSASPEVAEYLSRALECHATWFGLAGRSLAYRVRRFHLGRRTDEINSPPELFGMPEPFALPAYVDVEKELLDLLLRDGLPPDYLFLRADELGMSGDDGDPDAVAVLGAPWSEARVEEKRFLHRRPRRDGRAPRTLFDRFDDAKQVVADEVVLRGTWDESRARSLLKLMHSMARRREVPAGWRHVYLLAASAGPDLLTPLGELFAREKASYAGLELAVE